MLLLQSFIFCLLTMNLVFSLEILETSPENLPDNLYTQITNAPTTKQISDLVNHYKLQLYHKDHESSLINAQSLFAIFTSTKNHTAIDTLADYYYEQMEDSDLGIPLYEHGANYQSPHCLFKLARIELSLGHHENALGHLLSGARLFDNFCLCMLAQKILDGTFKDRPHSEAKKYLMISAHQQFTVAITELAKYLMNPEYGKPHYLLAYRLVSTIPDDNRARQLMDRLKTTEVVTLYINRDFLKLAEIFYIGEKAPQNTDLAIALVKISSLSSKQKNRFIEIIKENNPWKQED